jgi:hypothetical protein
VHSSSLLVPTFGLTLTTRNTTTVQGESQLGGFGIYPINHVLTPPSAFSQAVTGNNVNFSVNALLGVLNSTQLTLPDGQNQTFTAYLDSDAVRGFTFFAPNDAAIQAAASELQSLGSNATALQIVLGNHVRCVSLMFLRQLSH